MKLFYKSIFSEEGKAFTLIEMIVSISVITMITAIFIANYRSANKRSDLIMAAQNLVADLHLAQNNTLGLVKYNAAVPASGWGVYFDIASSSYVLFADLDAAGTSGYMSLDAATEARAEYGGRVTTLAPDIRITKLTTNGGVIGNTATVTFLPPDPRTNIYRDAVATSTSLEIEMTEGRNNSIKTVRVNFLGLIEVLD